jgi:uncharacterized membrane protein YedE/YeeE
MPSSLAAQYRVLFARPWPVTLAAVLVATVNVFLFAFDRPWSASDGMRNWGDWILTGAGVVHRADLLPPWLYSGSIMNAGVLLGGTVAALLGREFAVRVPARGELVKGLVGGLFLGVGAMLALGCNIGGFFSATSALSLSGPAMMAGLLLGAFLGIRYLVWETTRRPQWSRGRRRTLGGARAGQSRQPWLGLALAVLLLGAANLYARAGYAPQGVFLVFGAVLGVVFQRSRLCLVRAFREPFFTGDGEHTRAAALAVVVSTLGFTILKFTDLKDQGEWVLASAGPGALGGGAIFGVGMVLAGGCGAGSIWRAGEGQVKLWAAMLTFALGASLTRLALGDAAARGRLGRAVFLPAVLGWGGAIAAVVVLMLAWAAFATWNEASGRFTAG